MKTVNQLVALNKMILLQPLARKGLRPSKSSQTPPPKKGQLEDNYNISVLMSDGIGENTQKKMPTTRPRNTLADQQHGQPTLVDDASGAWPAGGV